MEVSLAAAAYAARPRSGSRLSAILAATLVLTCLAGCRPAATTPTATIADLRTAVRDGADVVIAGHITYVAPEAGVAFIQDATQGIPIELGPAGVAAAPGDYVTLAARVRGLHALARLTRPRVLSAQRSSLPDPAFADPEAMVAGALNATRVKLAARVQAATRSARACR